jgi:hypothetical protein
MVIYVDSLFCKVAKIQQKHFNLTFILFKTIP